MLNNFLRPRRVVVTGIGCLTPIGIGREAFWASLKGGVSGVLRISAFDASGSAVQIAGEVQDFDWEAQLNRKDRKHVARTVPLALAAACEAMADAGIDTTDMALDERRAIGVEIGTGGGVLHDKLALAAPASLERAVDLIASGNPPRTPQDNSLSTHCGKLKREDGRLDWTRGATELERLIRAYNPWPGTSCLLPDGKPLKVHRATLLEGDACPTAGTIISADPKAGLIVSCGSGLLKLDEVQAEGGKRLPAADFLRGHPQEVGTRFV